ncbi:heme exporter protein CcmD [Methylocystis sp. WRRC1]|uniref:heme exporter protein CcmD n=1 Tax=Methylocystis sp. WRRC1 TaxID=1732014 RepID=UPI001D14FACC|nr:heme exporter protein CcmD [Methylocystis sp. WRRC1]MCC3245885.1 heme exporter protein CcmD [Methylocystis sp. WRRC1]
MSEHASFIILAYGVAFVVIGGVATRIILDYRRLRSELARFGAAGQRDEGDAA